MPVRANNHTTGATLGFEAKLWQAADALGNNMDAAEYNHVVLALIFLKYMSNPFEQEPNYTTWRLARMNRALCGIDEKIAHRDTSRNDRHLDLKADYIPAKPPFKVRDGGGELLKDDRRWQYGAPNGIRPTQDRRVGAAE